MSEKKKPKLPTEAVAAGPALPPDPTEAAPELDVEAQVEQLILQIRQSLLAVFGFTYAPLKRRREVAVAASKISERAYRALAQACDASPVLATAGMLTGAEIRKFLALSNGYGNLIKEFAVLERAAEDSLVEQEAIMGRRGMRAIKIARTLDFDVPGERETVVPHLVNVEEAIKRKKKAAPDPESAKARKTTTSEAVAKSASPPVGDSTSMEFKAGRDL